MRTRSRFKVHISHTMGATVANNTRYRRSQVGRDLKPSYCVNYQTEDENTLFLSPGVISKVQVFKKASLSPILVEQAGAYSKPLVTIEAPLHVHLLQLLVPAFLFVKNQHSSHSSMSLGLFGAQSV